MHHPNDPIGRRVRDLRLQRALSQQDLADRAGVHRLTVLQLEAGTRPALPRTMRKIAAALAVPVMALTIGQPSDELCVLEQQSCLIHQ